MKLKVLIIEDEDAVADLLKKKISARLKKLKHTHSFQRCNKITGSASFLRRAPRVVLSVY